MNPYIQHLQKRGLPQAELEQLQVVEEQLTAFKEGRAEKPPKLTRTYAFEVRQDPDNARTLIFTISDETIDRYDSVIKADGWVLENYLKNPVFLYCHNYYHPPIGRTVKIWVEDNARLKAAVKFPDEGIFPFADLIYNLYSHNPPMMNAVSVGWIPLEWENHYDEDDTYDGPRRIYTKNELLEHSAVPVPGNPNALQDIYQGSLNLLDNEGRFAFPAEFVQNEVPPNKKAWHNYLRDAHYDFECEGETCGQCSCGKQKSQTPAEEKGDEPMNEELKTLLERILSQLSAATEQLGVIAARVQPAANPAQNQGQGDGDEAKHYSQLLLSVKQRKDGFQALSDKTANKQGE